MPRLSRQRLRYRDFVTVSSLIAAGSTPFLPFYLNRALVHGLTKPEIRNCWRILHSTQVSNAISRAVVYVLAVMRCCGGCATWRHTEGRTSTGR